MSDTDAAMYRFLLRWQDGDDELYYAGGYQQGTHDAGTDDLIGVCKTEKRQRPGTADSFEEFQENVEESALSVKWFSDPIRGGDSDE